MGEGAKDQNSEDGVFEEVDELVGSDEFDARGMQVGEGGYGNYEGSIEDGRQVVFQKSLHSLIKFASNAKSLRRNWQVKKGKQGRFCIDI
jgi:hypothetical protein